MKKNLSTAVAHRLNIQQQKSSVILSALMAVSLSGLLVLQHPALAQTTNPGQTNPAQTNPGQTNSAPSGSTGANSSSNTSTTGTNNTPNLGTPNSAIGTPNTGISSPASTNGVPNSSIGTPNLIINTPTNTGAPNSGTPGQLNNLNQNQTAPGGGVPGGSTGTGGPGIQSGLSGGGTQAGLSGGGTQAGLPGAGTNLNQNLNNLNQLNQQLNQELNQGTTGGGTTPPQPWSVIRTPSTNSLVPSNNMPDNIAPDPALRGPLSDTPNTGTSTTSKDSGNLLPTDTIPLGVDEFEYTPRPLTIKGPVGVILGRVDKIAPHKPCNNCTGIEVRVQNLSPNPIIIDGEHAVVFSNEGQERAISEDYAMKTSGGMFTRDQKLLLAATFVGTFGLLEPVLQDHFSTSKTDFPVSYGVNETRRRLEDRRLSKRIILPGEDTSGVIYFNGTNLNPNHISIPIKTYPLGQPVGSIDLFPGQDNKASQLEPQQTVDISPQQPPLIESLTQTTSTSTKASKSTKASTNTVSKTTTVQNSSVKVKVPKPKKTKSEKSGY